MEAPDAETCVACHIESQGTGGTPCNIEEVEPIFVKLFMGDGLPLDQELTLTKDGKVNTAFRTILVSNIQKKNANTGVKDYIPPLSPTQPKSLVMEAITSYKGRWLCMIAEPNQIVLSAQLKELLDIESESSLYASSLSTSKVLTVGYSNPSHFSRIFHESFGYSPSELNASMS